MRSCDLLGECGNDILSQFQTLQLVQPETEGEGEREGRQFEIKKEIFLHNTSPPQPIEHWQ